MGKKGNLNGRFLCLQAIVVMTSCVGNSFITPILQRFGYEPFQIGVTMTCAAITAAVAKPLWGYLNDRFACAKQLAVAGTALGCAAYALLVYSGGQRVLTALAAMLLYLTFLCIMGLVDSWAVRLISDGWTLNYAITRAGGSLSYAFMAAGFGVVMADFGPKPGLPVLCIFLVLLVVTVWSLPNPKRTVGQARAVSMPQALRVLAHNRVFVLAVVAYFLCSITSSAFDSFFSVMVTGLGGTEEQVGIGLFCQAVSEVPVMFAYSALRRRIHCPAAYFLAAGMAFFGLKTLALGLADSFAMVFAVNLLHGLCYATLMAGCVDFVLETVPVELLATAHLLYSAVGNSLGAVVGNALNGGIAQVIGVQPMMVVVSTGGFVGALLVVYAMKRRTT